MNWGERVRKELLISPGVAASDTSERLRLWPALEGNGMVFTSGETKHRFMVVVVVSIVLVMTGWVYALGWVALKLI
jgi:hypothetical protein